MTSEERGLTPAATPSGTPRVSVIMTVHNASAFLREAIDSVLAQHFGDWELVIVDDGSTDDSPAILATYRDHRIRTTALTQNIGRLRAVRRAVESARGEYVAILDADDVARPDRLGRQVALLDANAEVLLVGSWARMIDEAGTVIGTFHPPVDPDELREVLGWANPMVHSSVIYRAAAAREAGGYPPTMLHSHDCALWMRLAARGTVAILPDELCDQRVVATSMTRGPRFRADVVKDGILLAREAREILRPRGRAARRNRDAMLVARVKWGVYLLRTGRRAAGVGALIGAALRDPVGLLRTRAYRKQYLRYGID
jgi:glycosyltransferase involved in cell wall biosynthesis